MVTDREKAQKAIILAKLFSGQFWFYHLGECHYSSLMPESAKGRWLSVKSKLRYLSANRVARFRSAFPQENYINRAILKETPKIAKYSRGGLFSARRRQPSSVGSCQSKALFGVCPQRSKGDGLERRRSEDGRVVKE
ncbi:hypothetical protein L596_001258 [Steinernema carpocapsae]|uniref:Uncharacterized protein n=1 Tax=Steinernema carpocapsae TaxID=34508 RepID=A0A4U8UN80_STECR|nr:hypothetical protein L596_001258 [Steinernema carpocapsae]